MDSTRSQGELPAPFNAAHGFDLLKCERLLVICHVILFGKETLESPKPGGPSDRFQEYGNAAGFEDPVNLTGGGDAVHMMKNGVTERTRFAVPSFTGIVAASE